MGKGREGAGGWEETGVWDAGRDGSVLVLEGPGHLGRPGMARLWRR